MNIPKTEHKKVTYRDGKTGILLTSVRKNTSFPVMTIRDEDNNIIHHDIYGKYVGMKDEWPLDIIIVE